MAMLDTSRRAEDGYTIVLDESYRPASITVGGLLAATAGLPRLAASWRALKIELGLTARDELKYDISEQHPARARLDAAGWNQARRVPKMLKWIADQPIKLLADTLIDWRSSETAAIQQLYFHAFDWCLRRTANHVQFDLGSLSGPHTVLVDMPGTATGVDEANLTGYCVNCKTTPGPQPSLTTSSAILSPNRGQAALLGNPSPNSAFSPNSTPATPNTAICSRLPMWLLDASTSSVRSTCGAPIRAACQHLTTRKRTSLRSPASSAEARRDNWMDTASAYFRPTMGQPAVCFITSKVSLSAVAEPGSVRRRDVLGGLPHEYQGAAA